MGELFASGRVIDVILGLVVLEAALIAVYGRKRGGGLSLATTLGNLLSGAFLLLAVRSALVKAEWAWVALFLFAALIAHLFDLRQRSRHPP
jgi:hypothetical protein